MSPWISLPRDHSTALDAADDVMVLWWQECCDVVYVPEWQVVVHVHIDVSLVSSRLLHHYCCYCCCCSDAASWAYVASWVYVTWEDEEDDDVDDDCQRSPFDAQVSF